MKTVRSAFIIMFSVCLSFGAFSCTKDNTKKIPNTDHGETPLSDIGIDKKYLSEGFISNDIYRVVIVSPKDASASEPEVLMDKAKKRARVSLERSLAANDIQSDRNVKAEILILIEQNGRMTKKEFEHNRYDVYYFDITKKNMLNYLKIISTQK
jgi:hypothetical protein